MRSLYLVIYFVFCMYLSSCSHNPIEDFEKIKIGDDKQSVLEKAGSPIRSRFRDGKDIWTYRFIVNDSYLYKEIVLDGHKVVEVRAATETSFKEIEKKEKFIEEQLNSTARPKVLEKKNKKPVIDDAYIEKNTSQPKKDDFVPVEGDE